MRVARRRRRENKTDYLKRIKLLKSGSPRVVFRKTNKYILAQYVTSEEALDKIGLSISSKNLLKYGWPEELKGSLKSTPAAYLAGYLIGKQIIEKKFEKPIIDLGMIRVLHKNKVYSFMKGLIDSGVKLEHKKDIFPSEERIKGAHMKKDFSKIFEEIKSNLEKA